MPSTAPRIAHSHRAATPDVRMAVGPVARPSDLLDADCIDFDAWLLPPVAIDGGERMVRLVSTIAGPVAVLGVVALVLAAIF